MGSNGIGLQQNKNSGFQFFACFSGTCYWYSISFLSNVVKMGIFHMSRSSVRITDCGIVIGGIIASIIKKTILPQVLTCFMIHCKRTYTCSLSFFSCFSCVCNLTLIYINIVIKCFRLLSSIQTFLLSKCFTHDFDSAFSKTILLKVKLSLCCMLLYIYIYLYHSIS